MLTEVEARTKWCPFVTVSTGRSYPANRMNDADGPVPAGAHCLASDCMAWRDAGEEPRQKENADYEYRKTGRRLDVERIGFCGRVGCSS